MINEINDARREQPAGIGQTRVAVSQMGDVTQHNATLVETARTSRTSMEGRAAVLLEKVSGFCRRRSPFCLPHYSAFRCNGSDLCAVSNADVVTESSLRTTCVSPVTAPWAGAPVAAACQRSIRWAMTGIAVVIPSAARCSPSVATMQSTMSATDAHGSTTRIPPLNSVITAVSTTPFLT